AALMLPDNRNLPPDKRRWENVGLYLLAAFVFGTIACVNTWDMPVYALLLTVVLVIRTVHGWQASPGHPQGDGVGEVHTSRPLGRDHRLVSLGFSLVGAAILCGLGYLF